ncbi:hypothetical protein QFC22_005322 [Naganishia vaughanmartiniae]|uniref:Uncharacterized protein n=1 Tax=Naganishia vaughanmartiniae TaxID=1424756 RepID=A0ACC2WV49_9TREE|nr:hypothetical protein QFC22_005322 [Naganishia vaughanmartiniae]
MSSSPQTACWNLHRLTCVGPLTAGSNPNASLEYADMESIGEGVPEPSAEESLEGSSSDTSSPTTSFMRSNKPPSSASTSFPLAEAPKLLAQEVNLPTLFDFATSLASIRDVPITEDLQKLLDSERRRQQVLFSIREKKQKRLDKDRASAGFEFMDNHADAKDEQQGRVRLFTEEREAVIGMQLEKNCDYGERHTEPLLLEPSKQDQILVQGLVDLIQREVGDNTKFPLDQKFCLKRHSEVSAEKILPGHVVIDDSHQDIIMFRYPTATSSTAAERLMMDYMCCSFAGQGVDSWIKALESSVATRYPEQPFSTEVKLYLINRHLDMQEIGNSVPDFAQIFPSRTHGYSSSAIQGTWTSLRIGMTLEIYAAPAKLYQTPPHGWMIAHRRAILQHLYPGELPAQAFDSPRGPAIVDLEQFYRQLPQPPALSTRLLDSLQPPEMSASLLPFQKRSIAWLLQRERVSDFDRIAFYHSETWEKVVIGSADDGVPVAYSRLTGKVLPIEAFPEWACDSQEVDSEDIDDFTSEKDEFGLHNVRGSMLCEEMGLGKTLEVIALVMLNRRQNQDLVANVLYDRTLEMNVTEVSATLIVTPETLIGQWRQEIKQHAPTLRVLVYEGWKTLLQPLDDAFPAGKRKTVAPEEEVWRYQELVDKWMQRVAEADIVLTTFGTVQMDWDVAPPPAKRARRSCATYVDKVRPLSALLLCHWYRVAIDEIQELDIASASKAANMIKTIKRDYSLAISGTPAKASVQDLASSLSFLGVKMPPQVWNRIVTPAYSKAFHAIFNNIAIRHPKSSLSAQELTIPPQQRFLVPIRLSSIEWAYYKETYENNMDRLQRSQHGYTDSGRLRAVLHTLRMICTHLQVGLLGPNPNANGGRAVRLRLDNRIMPILDALQRMEDDAEAAVFSRFVEVCRHQIRRTLLLILQDSKNWKLSVRIYEELYRDVTHQLTYFETKAAGISDDHDGTASAADDDQETDERVNRLNILGSRKNALRLLHHEIAFRLGDIYSSNEVDFEDKSQKEDEWYSTAGRMRSELLESSAKSANEYRPKLVTATRRSKVNDFEELEIEYPGQLGLRGQRIQEPLTIRIDCLNDNAEFLWNARAKIITALQEAIDSTSTPSGGVDGKDYQQTLQEQHELEAYMWFYQCALADRTEFMVEERSALALQADKAEAIRQAEAEDQEAQAEEVDIREELTKQRNDIRHAAQKGISLKAAYIGLNAIRSNTFIRPEEDAICRMEVDRLKAVIRSQTQIIKRLTEEFTVMNGGFNRRVAHYKALQAISDTVEEVELETGDAAEDLVKINERIVTAQAAYDKVNARRRYLTSVRMESTEDMCPICCEQLGDGRAADAVILACLHRLCASCYRELCFKFDRPVCPTCRRRVEMNDDVQKITYKLAEPLGILGEIKAEDAESASIQSTLNPADYNIAPEDPEMLSVHVKGSWGSKLDRLIRQLKYWRQTQPEVKHIIFSSWKDALRIVEAALNANGISWRGRSVKKDDTSIQEFTEDPDILVFLLHGERENSGLTL